MKRLMSTVVVFGACLLITLNPGVSSSLTINFTDNTTYWPQWGNTDHDSWPGTDNNLDTIGFPNFTGGSVEVNNFYLTAITFSFASWGSGSGWNKLEPGDLFLNVDEDTNWEYVIYADNNPNKQDGQLPGSWNYNLYATDLALNDTTAYVMSGKDNTGYWSGYLIRDTHPIGLNPTVVSNSPSLGAVSFNGWTTSSLVFTFPAQTIPLTSGIFTIGFTVNCANDVVYETLELPRPPQQVAPEPASMLLMGSGLVGLAGFLRAQRKKDKKV